MRKSSLARVVAWLLLGPALVVASMAIAPSEAEAGRRVIRAGARAVVPMMRDRSGGEQKADEASTSTNEGGESAAPGIATPIEPARAAAAVTAKPAAPAKPADVEVAGCAPGNYCIVCLAGCTGNVDGVVSAVAKLNKN